MKIVAITGKFGSGKSFYSRKINEKLNSSMVVNLDSVFFELINNDQDIKKAIIQKYGENAYNKNNNIDLSVIQEDEESFSVLFDICRDKFNKKILTIIEKAEEFGVETLVFDWFMLPKTIAFEKADFKILINPNQKDREQSLISRDSTYTPEIIEKKDKTLGMDYMSYHYDEIVSHSYQDNSDEIVERTIKGINEIDKRSTDVEGR